MKNLKTQLAVLLLSTLCLFTGAYGQIRPSVDAATLNEDHASSAPQPTFAARADARAYTYSVLYSFSCAPNCSGGVQPFAGLIQDAAGNLYGTTAYGGGGGGGTVFKIDTLGNETVLYSFCSVAKCADGSQPFAGLIRDAAGNLYGTTESGGAFGGGTVFKVGNKGHEAVLHNFCSKGGKKCTDGAQPFAGLIQDAAGDLYGTTNLGGANGGGTVFKLDTTGHETVLYSFCSEGGANCTDGAYPNGLIQDAAGNLYGTTLSGGAGPEYCPQDGGGCGTVFKVDTTGHETALYSFCSEGGANCFDGAAPEAGLIQDAVGNLYGTTFMGGVYDIGTVFKLDTTGQETVLYSFQGYPDGQYPLAGLIQDTAGNLYGTTDVGGAHQEGTVFRLNTTGHETVLYSFCSVAGCADGSQPMAGLIQDAAGDLYGTTSGLGPNGIGTVFKLAGATDGTSATITLTSSPNPSTVDQPVEFSVVVSGNGAMPIGSVTFEQGKAVLGTVTLVDGEAGLVTTFTRSDKFSIVASYSGDLNYKASKTKPFEQVVEK